MASPADPAPRLVIDDGRVIELDGVALGLALVSAGGTVTAAGR
jgi:propanediol dehydratase large subunit